MRRQVLICLVGLSACSGAGTDRRSVDLNAAAARAEGDIANYAAAGHDGGPPVPDRSTGPAIIFARYACTDGTWFAVRFDSRAHMAALMLGDAPPVSVVERRAGSGMWYAGDGYDFRGKGRTATLMRPDRTVRSCEDRS